MDEGSVVPSPASPLVSNGVTTGGWILRGDAEQDRKRWSEGDLRHGVSTTRTFSQETACLLGGERTKAI